MGQVVIHAIATVWKRVTLVRGVKRKHVFLTWDATTEMTIIGADRQKRYFASFIVLIISSNHAKSYLTGTPF
jgi:hypothetical protein